MKKIFLWAISGVFLISCQPQVPTVDQAAEEEKLMETSRQWAKSKTNEEYLSYWHENAVLMAPGQPTLNGHEDISKMLESTKDIPGFAVDWEPQEAFVSKSGDLGYLIERTSFTMNDSLGNPMTEFHKTVTIWKKQEDGSWINVVDMYNQDPSITSIR